MLREDLLKALNFGLDKIERACCDIRHDLTKEPPKPKKYVPLGELQYRQRERAQDSIWAINTKNLLNRLSNCIAISFGPMASNNDNLRRFYHEHKHGMEAYELCMRMVKLLLDGRDIYSCSTFKEILVELKESFERGPEND